MAESDGMVGDAARNVEGCNATLIQAIAPLLVIGSLLLWNLVRGAYAGFGRELPDSFDLLANFSVSMSIILWFWNYSRQHHIAWVLDMGWFLLIAWIVVVPYYLLMYEGKRGLRRIGLFCLAYVVTWVAGIGLGIALRVMTAA